ncbi:MAG: hypothetical protein J3R72DRAFT_179346 [Linnemannia gamsii]|nr:MAG: hypothetical protein J3R72DRAFT_179346 [Linnemannia gamsii]
MQPTRLLSLFVCMCVCVSLTCFVVFCSIVDTQLLSTQKKTQSDHSSASILRRCFFFLALRSLLELENEEAMGEKRCIQTHHQSTDVMQLKYSPKSTFTLLLLSIADFISPLTLFRSFRGEEERLECPHLHPQ